MTVRISKEFGFPIEEVASWSWRKKEIYANGLAELNRFDRDMAQNQSDEYNTPTPDGADVPDNVSAGNMGQADHHSALAEYDNISKMH